MSLSDAAERQCVRKGSTTADEYLARIWRPKASNQAVSGQTFLIWKSLLYSLYHS